MARPFSARQQCVLLSDGSKECYRYIFFNTAAAAAVAAAAAAAMLSLAALDEIQRPNIDDEADESSPCAKRTLCSPKRRSEDVLEHSSQLNADPLGAADRPRSSFN